MKFTQGISYCFLIILTFVTLSILEYIGVNFIIEMFTYSFYVKLIVAVIFLFIINPILTYFITKKIPFKINGLASEDIYQKRP